MLQDVSLPVSELTKSLREIEIDFTDTQEILIKSLSLACASISAIAVIFIITSHILFSRLRSFTFDPMLMLLIADLVRTCAYFLIADDNQGYSQINAFLMTFGELASVFWVGLIGFIIHNIYLLKNSCWLSSNYRCKYYAFFWGSSVLITALPFLTADYECCGYLWCWISVDTTMGSVWALMCYFVPLSFILFYLSVVYYKIWRLLKYRESFTESHIESLQQKSENAIRHQLIKRKRIYIYPAIFFLTVLYTVLDRILQLALDKRYFWLVLLAHVSINLQGLFYSIVYGHTTTVRSEWSALLCLQNDKIFNDNLCPEKDDVEPHPASLGDETGDPSNRGVSVTESTYMVASSMYSEELAINGYNSSSTFMITS